MDWLADNLPDHCSQCLEAIVREGAADLHISPQTARRYIGMACGPPGPYSLTVNRDGSVSLHRGTPYG